MSHLKTIQTDWYPGDQLIITKISGDVEKDDVIRWKQTLHDVLKQIDDSGTFKILVNVHGFVAANVNAHKYFQDIVPLTLADYGSKVGYVNLFPKDAGKINIKNNRNIQCVAAANCHQDATKWNSMSHFTAAKTNIFLPTKIKRKPGSEAGVLVAS